MEERMRGEKEGYFREEEDYLQFRKEKIAAWK
jgi:hypothetical protein